MHIIKSCIQIKVSMFLWHHVLGYLAHSSAHAEQATYHSTAHAEQATYHCLIYAMIHKKNLY